jgi:hypothetical protein
VLLDEAELLKGHFAPADGARSEQASVALTEITAGEVSLLGYDRDNAAPGRLYYTLNLRYFTPAREVEALNRGIAVSHKYTLLDEPGAPVTTASLGDTVRITVTVVTEADRNYVVVEDFLPAGLEPIDPNLRAVDPALRAQLEAERQEAALGDELPYHAPWFHWYWSPWNQADTRDDRVTLRALQLPRGVHEFIYYARATTPGAFFVGPARAEESFFPEVFGRSDSSTFTVVP